MRRLAPIAVIVSAALLGLGFVARAEVRSLAVRAKSCVTRQIATAAAREGSCTRYFGPFYTHRVSYVVADAGHRLRMAGYSVRLLDTHTRPYRTASMATQDPADYPDGLGTLVSVRIAVTNRGSRALRFRADRTNILVDRPGAGLMASYAASFQAFGRRERIRPAGSVVVGPGHSRTGWVAYVAPQWTPEVLHVRAADLQFLQRQGVVGQIRLWKYAGAGGRAALGLPRAARGAQL